MARAQEQRSIKRKGVVSVSVCVFKCSTQIFNYLSSALSAGKEGM